MPYPNSIVLVNTNNYGTVTGTLFSVSRNQFINASISDKEHMYWIFPHRPLEGRSLEEKAARLKIKPQERSKRKIKKIINKKIKKKQKHMGKLKECIFKMLKKSSRNKSKYMLPLILGLLAAKSLLILIVLKALTFISAKGLMLGLFSTALASILSLKGMFDHSHGYQNRKDDTKTQVEVIQIPSNNKDHVYYDNTYGRRDYIPMTK